MNATNAKAAPGVNLSDPAVVESVRQIYFSRFSRRIAAAGIPVEDGLQEVLLGIEIRNHGRSPWDPERGRSLTSYVYMVCSGVLANLWKADHRWTSQHQVGVRDRSNQSVDLAESEIYVDPTTEDRLYLCERMGELASEVGEPGLRYLRAVGSGSRYSARREVGLSEAEAQEVEDLAREWAGLQP